MKIRQKISGFKNTIYLQAVQDCDIGFFHAVYSDIKLMQFIGQPVTHQQSASQLKFTVKTMAASEPDHLTYLIVDTNTNQYIGITGLTWINREDRTTAEIGVLVVNRWQRQGVAHQSKKMMLDYGFNQCQLEVIVASNQIDNMAAMKANNKLGFNKGEISYNNKKQIFIQEWIMTRSMWNDS